eukprot:Protomagalhaensia_sp_Gyna_25__724@NODE_1342_length_1924_cov_40_303979_g1074_i0_p2_GENE_NODE_1342_length_1924_cov_40_303979_g1074_i0NODE_1342_length_1924_cov_40_303979_g1074_i0_p2_ORF_typecomplete_len277_score50_92Sec1/PF00995_23/3_5e26ABATE/PF07336_11/3_8e03ABATE/PF07336_11/4_4e03ABATE/PF07336_11/0_098_NODE_1342_length_1924_cov_40_303979_g1074_i03833
MAENMNKTFGEVTAAAAAQVTAAGAFPQESPSLRALLDDYAEKKRRMGIVLRHGDLVHRLTEIVTQDKLLEASLLEQRIVCEGPALFSGAAQSELRTEILNFLRDPKVSPFEKFRLGALQALRDRNSELEMERLCQEGPLPQLLQFMAGWPTTSADWNVLSAAKEVITRSMGPNVSQLMQYRSRLRDLAEAASKNMLNRRAFPPVTARVADAAAEPKQTPRLLIIFVVGGVTFEEAREIESLAESLPSCHLYIGGTCITNTKTLLADIAQLSSAST